MGISSNLFYSTDTEKQTLHRRVIPSEEQQAVQQERWNDLIEYLSGDLQEKTGYTITSWLQGSYKFGTQTRPPRKGEEYDIDLGVYFNWSGDPEDGNYGPSQLKSLVQESLKAYKEEAEDEVIEIVVPPKMRCSRIRFTGDFHIDVPSYHTDPDQDTRMLATEKEWENSDPKAIYKWFKEQAIESEGEQLRRIIRYLKIWSALNIQEKQRPSSILLTVLTTQSYVQLSTSEKDGDDTTLKFCVDKILEKLKVDSSVPNPVNDSENLNRLDSEAFSSFVSKLENLLNISARALKAGSEFESAAIWQEAFKHFFPLPVVKEGDRKNLAIVPVLFEPRVAVTATPKENNHHTYTGINEIGIIPKECILKFKITNSTNLPAGATIEWIARNEGKDAEFQNDLGHYAGEGIEITDATAYKGTHFMDVVIKGMYGIVIGFRRIPVSVSGIVMPPRNPKKKPGFRFRRRR